jgi:hypothetical protein
LPPRRRRACPSPYPKKPLTVACEPTATSRRRHSFFRQVQMLRVQNKRSRDRGSRPSRGRRLCWRTSADMRPKHLSLLGACKRDCVPATPMHTRRKALARAGLMRYAASLIVLRSCQI